MLHCRAYSPYFIEPRPSAICCELHSSSSPSSSLSFSTNPTKGCKYSTWHLSSSPVFKFLVNAKVFYLSFQAKNFANSLSAGQQFSKRSLLPDQLLPRQPVFWVSDQMPQTLVMIPLLLCYSFFQSVQDKGPKVSKDSPKLYSTS